MLGDFELWENKSSCICKCLYLSVDFCMSEVPRPFEHLNHFYIPNPQKPKIDFSSSSHTKLWFAGGVVWLDGDLYQLSMCVCVFSLHKKCINFIFRHQKIPLKNNSQNRSIENRPSNPIKSTTSTDDASHPNCNAKKEQRVQNEKWFWCIRWPIDWEYFYFYFFLAANASE